MRGSVLEKDCKQWKVGSTCRLYIDLFFFNVLAFGDMITLCIEEIRVRLNRPLVIEISCKGFRRIQNGMAYIGSLDIISYLEFAKEAFHAWTDLVVRGYCGVDLIHVFTKFRFRIPA